MVPREKETVRIPQEQMWFRRIKEQIAGGAQPGIAFQETMIRCLLSLTVVSLSA